MTDEKQEPHVVEWEPPCTCRWAHDAEREIVSLRAERDRLDQACDCLFEALRWINDAAPQLVADAEHKFGFNIHSATVEDETTHAALSKGGGQD